MCSPTFFWPFLPSWPRLLSPCVGLPTPAVTLAPKNTESYLHVGRELGFGGNRSVFAAQIGAKKDLDEAEVGSAFSTDCVEERGLRDL